MNARTNLAWLCGLAVWISLSGESAAQFTLIDNFGTYTLGTDINGQGGWTATGGGATSVEVAADPTNPLNPVLRFSAAADAAPTYHAISIPNSSTAATVFFRTRRDGASNMSWGTSDVAAPSTNFADFETQFNLNEAAPTTLNVRDAGAFDAVDTFNTNTWYDMWMVIDNAANTYEVYMDSGSGPVLLDGPAAQTVFGFRNGAASNALTNLFLMAGAGHNANFYFDDLYIDVNGENLSDPTAPLAVVPEPASLALWSFLAAGLALGLVSRRGRRPAALVG